MKLVTILVTLMALAPFAAAKKTGLAPISGRVIKIEVRDKDTFVTVAVGSNHGVDKEYACAFIAPTGTPVVGKCDIIRVDKAMTVVKTDLARDKVTANTTVKLGPILR